MYGNCHFVLEGNIKMCRKELGYVGTDRVELAQDRDSGGLL